MLKYILTLIVMVAMSGCGNKEAKVHNPKQVKGKMDKMKKMKMFQSVPANQALLLQNGDKKMHCINCGMHLPMFYKTNHSATLQGKTKQYCSIHCLAKDIKEGKKVKNFKVVDTNTLTFIDAKKAWYVLGSRKKGTMSKVSKYAFSTQEAASAFVKENGGHIGRFEEALALSKKDFQ